ncbi:hypothetical protein ACEPAI_1295 [Sanghuangporus weigelae]
MSIRVLPVIDRVAGSSLGKSNQPLGDERGPASEWRFNVYLPDHVSAHCEVITLSEGKFVADLIEAIQKKYGQKLLVPEGSDVEFVKCGEVSAESDNIFGRVKDWLGTKDRDYMHMQKIHELKKYFPDGPTRDAVHVVVITTYGMLTVLSILSVRPTYRFQVRICLDPLNYELLADTGVIDPDKLQNILATSLPGPKTSPAGKGFHSMFRVYGWRIETEMAWQKFCLFWTGRRGKCESEEHILALAVDEFGFEMPGHRLNSITQSKNCLFVRESYKSLVKDVRALKKKNKHKGLVITGHPGVGKTTWLWYMLVCCLMDEEPVVFHYNGRTRLFLDGRVYYLKETDNVHIPHAPEDVTFSLIDADEELATPPTYLTHKIYGVFPVQASSPNSKRYNPWLKALQGYSWGMPLWAVEEIKKGLKLDTRYESFLEALQSAIAHEATQTSDTADVTQSKRPPPFPSAAPSPGSAVAAPHREGALPVELEGVLGADTIDGPAKYSSDEPIRKALSFARDDSRNLRTAETTFELVVEDAIEQYGEVPRDISEAVFDGYESINAKIDAALNAAMWDLDKLMTAVSRLGSDRSVLGDDPPSHKLFAIQPVVQGRKYTKDDIFLPKFKSGPISKRIVAQVGRLQLAHARKFLATIRLFPESSSLAGWIFQSLACEKLASANVQSEMFSMVLTEHTDKHRVYVTPNYAVAPGIPFPNHPMRLAKCHFSNNKLELEPTDCIDECLCIPADTNHPLFDAFFANMSVTASQVVTTLYIIQTTLSRVHEGSMKGYAHIGSILEEVERRAIELQNQAQPGNISVTTFRKKRKRKKESNLTMIRYLYVCRTPQTQRTWKLPKQGWTTKSGEVYCLHLDFS